MENKIICGIQQLGVGVPNVHKAWSWYKKFFGYDVRIFEESARAELMLPYTGGQPHERHAALAINMQGGGGFEIWNYTSRTPVGPNFEIQLGDLGIFAGKIKSPDVKAAHTWMKAQGQKVSDLTENGEFTNFFVIDPLGNTFQVTGSKMWFTNQGKPTGGTYGAIIGVTDIEKSLKFYAQILEYDVKAYDETGVFPDFSSLPGGKGQFRRVILKRSKPIEGSFSPIFGDSQIELVQALDRSPHQIFENRFWGDLGFIHLCFDIRGMAVLREECKAFGSPFTVDSGDFDMGEASGAFAYIEDPDGTLIEFVETHKVPIIKKIGWYMSLRGRNTALPRWMLKAMGLNKAKDIK